MNKYSMSGKLMHKASDHNTKRCEVEKWVFLPHSDFERLKSNPYHEHEAITAAKDLMYEDEKAHHCIMLLDEHGYDGLLIEAEGFDYPSLSMFVPDAALIYERYKTSEAELKLHDMIKETADKIAELAHTDKTDFTSADMIDMDEVESLVKNAIVQQLAMRKDSLSNTISITSISCVSRNLPISDRAISSASLRGKPYTPVDISGKAMLLADTFSANASALE